MQSIPEKAWSQIIWIKDGNGESLYPISSFPINRTGDTVLFTQKVKGSGKIMGRRTVAGQVVKESYGTAKQRHTFTVNDRVKVLSEKHSRGATAARKVMRERKIKLGYIYGRLQKPDHVNKAGLSSKDERKNENQTQRSRQDNHSLVASQGGHKNPT
ncbi:hypothetical protein F2Q68_00018093, partial [Brassica cretica]